MRVFAWQRLVSDDPVWTASLAVFVRVRELMRDINRLVDRSNRTSISEMLVNAEGRQCVRLRPRNSLSGCFILDATYKRAVW